MAEALSDIGQPPVARPIRWRHGWRALRALVAAPDETEHVFELIHALGGDHGERLFQRFLRNPDGMAMLAERSSLVSALSEREALESMPEGSLGHVYARFMSAAGIDAQGLVDAAATVPREVEVDPARRWFFDRLRDQHDLWHVLTGYGRDLAGEAALLAFTHAQNGNRGIGAIVLTAAWRGPRSFDCRWQRYLLSCWRRGRRAAPLANQRWEELLPQPLADVRQRMRIEAPELAHPQGIISFEGDQRVAQPA
ncbi:MAG: Coq4 family protein [Myxococcota bacterium]